MKINSLNFVVILLHFVVFQFASFSQDGTLDPLFGTGGIVLTDIGLIDEALAATRQTDGKIVTAGFTGNIGSYSFLLTRHNEDGSLDDSFGDAGITITSLGVGEARCNAIQLQADGKILVIGTYLAAEGGPADIALARYNTNGTLDLSYGTDGIVITNSEDSEVFDGGMRGRVQADGKLVVLGFKYEDILEFLLLRYNTDGTLDNTFGDEGIVTPIIGDYSDESEELNLIFDGDENILVVSSAFAPGESHSNFSIVKYHNDGTLDLSFGTDGQVLTNIKTTDGVSSNDYGADIAFQSDGKIIVAGMIYEVDGAFALARYSATGVLDESFGTGGVMYTEMSAWAECTGMSIQANDKIIITGQASFDEEYNEDFVVIRYTANGDLDPTFGTGGMVVTGLSPNADYANDIMIIENEKILIVGTEAGEFGLDTRVALVQYLFDYELSADESTSSEQQVSVYPNPFNDFTTVYFDRILNGDNYVVIYDLLGQEVYRIENMVGANIQISKNQLGTGIYLLTFKENNKNEEIFVSKLVVE